MYFDPADIHHTGPDGDRVLYTVRFPDLRYDGKVRVSRERAAADGTEQWIADRLDAWAVKVGAHVVSSRLYSPVDLTDD